MIRKDFSLLGWHVTLYVSETCRHVCRIVSELYRMGCRGNKLSRAYRTLFLDADGIVMFTNYKTRRTLIAL